MNMYESLLEICKKKVYGARKCVIIGTYQYAGISIDISRIQLSLSKTHTAYFKFSMILIICVHFSSHCPHSVHSVGDAEGIEF